MKLKHIAIAAVLALLCSAFVLSGADPTAIFNADPSLILAVAAAGAPVEELKAAIQEILGTHTKSLSDQIAKADEEVKKFGVVTEETKQAIAKIGEERKAVDAKVEAELKRISDLDARLKDAEQKLAADKGDNKKGSVKSIGARFIESEQFKTFAKNFGGGQKFRGQSGQMEVKDITSLDASAGAGIWSFRQPEIVSEPYRPLSIRNLIPSIPVTSNLIEYVRTLVRTSNVDYVSEGAAKPKSDLTYERAETAVRKIAHYIKASMEVLADFPRLASLIDTELMQMLKVFEEDALLLGDGTQDTILGLIPQATTYDTGLNRVGDTRLDVIRHAILQVRQSFYPSTGIVLNPIDWERIELTKDQEGRYLIASATSTTAPRLWGLPVVESDAMPHGQFLVGAYGLAAEIYDRMAAAIYVSTEDGDNFIKNMVSVLCEERLGLAVKRPLAFVHGDFDDAGLSSGA